MTRVLPQTGLPFADDTRYPRRNVQKGHVVRENVQEDHLVRESDQNHHLVRESDHKDGLAHVQHQNDVLGLQEVTSAREHHQNDVLTIWMESMRQNDVLGHTGMSPLELSVPKTSSRLQMSRNDVQRCQTELCRPHIMLDRPEQLTNAVELCDFDTRRIMSHQGRSNMNCSEHKNHLISESLFSVSQY